MTAPKIADTRTAFFSQPAGSHLNDGSMSLRHDILRLEPIVPIVAVVFRGEHVKFLREVKEGLR